MIPGSLPVFRPRPLDETFFSVLAVARLGFFPVAVGLLRLPTLLDFDGECRWLRWSIRSVPQTESRVHDHWLPSNAWRDGRLCRSAGSQEKQSSLVSPLRRRPSVSWDCHPVSLTPEPSSISLA